MDIEKIERGIEEIRRDLAEIEGYDGKMERLEKEMANCLVLARIYYECSRRCVLHG